MEVASLRGIEIRGVPFDAPVARQLVTAALGDLAARYGGSGDDTPVAAADFEPPNGEFLVAMSGGVPMGCVGWRSHGDDAELKRLYTTPEARGRGVARQLLRAVQESARAHGRRRMILECGDRQPEAVGLYRSCGYQRIENFGYYRNEPGVLSFARPL